jgi:transcriptional regulator with XRE-family HTH domain
MGKRKETTWAGVLRRLLDETGMETAYRLAKASGVSQVGILAILNGHRVPGGRTIQAVLAAAGKPWGWLDEVMEHPPAEPKRKPRPR